jgi:hypothetical protein
MTATELRLSVVMGVALALILVVWLVRRYIDQQRRLVIAASVSRLPADAAVGGISGPARILAFGSNDCRQCHTLQAPVLQKVLAARGQHLQVTEVDAPSAPDLVEQYRVLTLPTTIVLDGAGRVHAVNYGFANSERLLKQVDKALANTGSAETATAYSDNR